MFAIPQTKLIVLASIGLVATFGVAAVAEIVAPTDIANNVLWLDASDASVFTLDGAAVTQWNDKSPQADHVSQSTSGLKPTRTSAAGGLQGRPVVQFTDDWLSTTTTTAFENTGDQAYTAFGVIKADTLGNGNFHQPVYGIGDATNTQGTRRVSVLALENTDLTTYRMHGGYTSFDSTDLTAGTYHVFTSQYSGGGDPYKFWVDGVEQTLGGTNLDGSAGRQHGFVSGKYYIGWHGYTSSQGVDVFSGEIAELIFYTGALDSANRGEVESYLTDKWIVPEPSTFALAGFGLLGLVGWGRRQRR
jgi:hypothetical protein